MSRSGPSGPSRRRLLVSGDEFHASLALVRALRAGGYVPYLAVAPRHTYASRSRAAAAVLSVPYAEETPDAFVGALADLADRHRADAILPGTEASLIAVARGRERLPCKLGAPDAAIVDVATDKERVLALAVDCGFDTPPSILATPERLAAMAREIHYPAILKPRRTRLAVGESQLAYYKARRIEGAEQLQVELERAPDVDWMVQPYIEGGLSAMAGVAWEGRLVCAVHQVSRRVWPPDVGYSCYAETISRDRAIESRASALLGKIGWSGLFQFQFLGGADGRRLLIDFNPRAYGSLALAVRAGANLPAIWAALVLGEQPAPASYRAGVRYRLEHNDLRALVAAVREGDLRGALAAVRPRPRTAHAVFSLRDPGPLLTTAEKLVGRRRG